MVGGSTAGLWTEGAVATSHGGGMGADWELAVTANQGTARRGKGTGALRAVRRVQSARLLGILDANRKIRKRTDTDVAFTR